MTLEIQVGPMNSDRAYTDHKPVAVGVPVGLPLARPVVLELAPRAGVPRRPESLSIALPLSDGVVGHGGPL